MEQLTTADIRAAYTRLHNLSPEKVKDIERFGMLAADSFSQELLNLPIDDFMVEAGFVHQEAKVDVIKRAYTKRIK
jgi:hypothetical protein